MLNKKIVRFFVVGFLIGFAVLTARAEDVKYESEVQKNIMVPMRDGVRLATDVYLPTRNGSIVDGKFPVILTRTPYSKENIGRSTAKYYVPHGYIVIAQDTRGRFKSEGVWKGQLQPKGNGESEKPIIICIKLLFIIKL